MGTYNTLHTSLICPRCGAAVEAVVDCHFGSVGEMARLGIGDRYPWRQGALPQNGGRPDGGSVDGEGYMECPHCNKDSHVRVLVREDVITGVEADEERRGYLPD